MKTKNIGIQKFLEEHMEVIAATSKSLLPVFREAFAKHGPQGVTEYAHQLIDAINEKTGINDKVSCSAGCHFCCYGEIAMSHSEATLIYSIVKQFQIPIDMILVDRQNRKPFHKLKYAAKRCAMLDDKGMCKIYDHRPSICRLYNSMDAPEKCNEKDGEPNIGTLRTIEGFSIATALMLFDEENGNRDKYTINTVLIAKEGNNEEKKL
jgi:Fe-S-cluster containining protein